MKLKTLLFILVMGLLGWMFTAMFFWTMEKNRAAGTPPTAAADAPPSPYQRVLGMDRLQWESLDLDQQREHLDGRLQTLQALPADHADRRGILPELRYWMATVATRGGDGDAALAQLEEAGVIPGSEDWFHLLRGAAMEAKREREAALDAYLTSFSYRLIPVVWDKLRQFEPPADELIGRTLAKLRGRSRPFADFQLQTPEGAPRSLRDYAGKVLLVNFFFPG